ncbi:GAF and ANTAR domain-containing protein [Amycolatopsis sp., V23-08]|uniref:GAF and ANTAR domain-containing protein n=1 Tax=Amycolatopsis heterodermiae TaxID=3110235 RepID=A0ABU5R5A3_9PSEU|nr:GAF and ANTAR domain-containing protein [Amycolatopsis sp., V23-08]MEA5360989.1 GAF and ANTAR domain-containing protein [Amycolatopsis sp., V23-08]
MTEDRRGLLDRLLAEGRHAGVGVERICAACAPVLDVSGAAVTVVSVLGGRQLRGLVHAGDATGRALEELQLTVGEGPCHDAYAGGRVLIADLAAACGRWPAFGPGAAGLGVAAVFSFPLQAGAARLGSLDLYRNRPGALTRQQTADALLLAELATRAVTDRLDGHAGTDLTWVADVHVEVHQAVGMVSIQLGTTADAALLRLRGQAFIRGETVTVVARQVVARTLRFTRDGEAVG